MSFFNYNNTLLAAIPWLFLISITIIKIASKIPYWADIPDV